MDLFLKNKLGTQIKEGNEHEYMITDTLPNEHAYMHDTVIDLMKEQNLQYMQQSLNSGKDPT